MQTHGYITCTHHSAPVTRSPCSWPFYTESWSRLLPYIHAVLVCSPVGTHRQTCTDFYAARRTYTHTLTHTQTLRMVNLSRLERGKESFWLDGELWIKYSVLKLYHRRRIKWWYFPSRHRPKRIVAAVYPKTCRLFRCRERKSWYSLFKSKLSTELPRFNVFSAITLGWTCFVQLYPMFKWHSECSFYHNNRPLERSDTYRDFAMPNETILRGRATFAHVITVERSRPPTQEGVGACKWTTWGSGAFCLKDCCLIHLSHARCTALRGNRHEPPVWAPRDIIYYEDCFWGGICDMKPVIHRIRQTPLKFCGDAASPGQSICLRSFVIKWLF